MRTASFAASTRAALKLSKSLLQYAPLALESLTHTLSRRCHRAGKAAAIEERVKGMGFDEAQAARIKDTADKAKGGAYGLF